MHRIGLPGHRRRVGLSKDFADNYVDETLEAYDVDETPGR
jgi:hypothetical protein